MARTSRAAPWAAANEDEAQALGRLVAESSKHSTHAQTAQAFNVSVRTVLRWWAWCTERGFGDQLPPRPPQTPERRQQAARTLRNKLDGVPAAHGATPMS